MSVDNVKLVQSDKDLYNLAKQYRIIPSYRHSLLDQEHSFNACCALLKTLTKSIHPNRRYNTHDICRIIEDLYKVMHIDLDVNEDTLRLAAIHTGFELTPIEDSSHYYLNFRSASFRRFTHFKNSYSNLN